MTYIQANFCNSMVDMDLFFLQICSTQLPAQTFLTTAIDAFGVADWLGMCAMSSPQEMEQDSMLEGLLTFLATLITSRTNLGNSEQTQCMIEISALLATGDKTHSQLLELMPERSGNAHTRNFEKFLKELSIFRRPPVGSENLDQGLFIPVPDVWEKYYDPLHVLLRAVHRRDFQTSMDRFSNYVKQKNKMPKSGTLWPPFRLPGPVGFSYSDPSCILQSRVLHSALLGILYRAVHSHNVSEHMLALAVFLLEMAVTFSDNNLNTSTVLECGRPIGATTRDEREAPDLLHCYPGDCLSENLRHTIARISLSPPGPPLSPAPYNTGTFDSDPEYDIDVDSVPMLPAGRNDIVMSSSGLEVAVPQDLSIVPEQSLVLHNEETNMDEDILPAQSLPPLTLGENVQAITEYSPRRNEIHLTLPPIIVPSESGMEVAIRRDSRRPQSSAPRRRNEMFHSRSVRSVPGMLLPFQRVQPVAVPSRHLDIVPSNSTDASAWSRRTHPGAKNKQYDGGNNYDSHSLVFDESIISLLLKLHSQLSGTLDSFSLDEDPCSDEAARSNDTSRTNSCEPPGMMDVDADAGPSTSNQEPPSSSSHQNPLSTSSSSSSTCSSSSAELGATPPALDPRIGDGPHFIGNLLKKIAKLDGFCLQSINEIRKSMWPNQREKQAEQRAREVQEKDERSKRAKERQQKMMEEFASKQKKFMEQATAEDMECCDEDIDEEFEEQPREKEYVCIICNRTSPSTESNPIGLVVLVESSGVIGHRRKTGNFIFFFFF